MISENIRILRKEKGWTQADLALQLYKSEDAVQKWESGEPKGELEQLSEKPAGFD